MKARLYSSNEILELFSRGRKDIFYNSRGWRNKSHDIQTRDNHECQWCKEAGKVSKQRLEVHHIKPLKFYPSLAYDDENLVSLCFDHHSQADNKCFGIKKVVFKNEEKW